MSNQTFCTFAAPSKWYTFRLQSGILFDYYLQWSGCLIALEAVLQVREGKGRPSIEKYKETAGKRDRTLLHYINLGYDTMHLVMGYDGNREKQVCDAGFERANLIIDRCALLYKEPVYA